MVDVAVCITYHECVFVVSLNCQVTDFYHTVFYSLPFSCLCVFLLAVPVCHIFLHFFGRLALVKFTIISM